MTWNFLPLGVAVLAAVHTWNAAQPSAAGPRSRYAASFSRQRGDNLQRRAAPRAGHLPA
ncbi:hypothetical protein OOK58_54775 [Streptomyces sp. NBC_01728]|uniref:hypothetical protein n=1 Tax=unclassified Streptomyces TaxID=2593676 RepID=UPI0022554C1C|nr:MULTISPECIES: hypothetical protein [unclassified Streptomyces]MCX4460561.1 hypothetical protein [Streptomyces sp. NBC_01719]MCX4500109.1 hypothetical protein [Streptomyces sp. NBC_01728]MCX4597853.1 hypothetical protein [Streptomyces sp. NBC_01549]